MSICSGWIVDGVTVNGQDAGGSSQQDQEFALDHGEKIITIEGSHCGFENRQVVGQITFTTSTGRIFGPMGHNGNPSTSPNANGVYSRFRFHRENGISQIHTMTNEFM